MRQKPNSLLLTAVRKPGRSKRWPTPGLDDVFIDDITVPATDGYPLAATLFLPRGAKRHAVLINSATAVPRKFYRGFAGYLAKRGCAVLTYDYRGTGDSRPQSLTGSSRSRWSASRPRRIWHSARNSSARMLRLPPSGYGRPLSLVDLNQ